MTAVQKANTFTKDGPESIVYRGSMLEVVEQPMRLDTKTVVFERARRAPGTRLIIVDTKTNKILITKEFRYELNDFDYRLPGGKVADSLTKYHQLIESNTLDQAVVSKAKEEAKQEAGIVAKTITPFHTSVVGATIEWDLYYFIIDDFENTSTDLETGENIEVAWYSFDDAQRMCLNGKISEERSALTLLRYLDN